MSVSADSVTKSGAAGIAASGGNGARDPAADPPPAGLWRRLTAAAYDGILLAALFFIVTAIVVARSQSPIAAGTQWFRLLLAATAWLYFAWSWTHGGQTVGMRAWQLRVVSAETPAGRAGWGGASLRFVGAFLPALPLVAAPAGIIGPTTAAALSGALYLLGFGAALLRRDRACWHDLLSRTRLIRVRGS